jgi:hypothetical protein
MARRRPPRTAKCLPSGDAAIDVLDDPSAWNALRLVGTAALRGVLIAGGLYAAGSRGRELALYTAAATGAVEAGVVAWAAWCVYK